MLDRLSFLALLAIPTVACTSTSRMSMEASPAFDVKVVERDGSRIVDLKVVQRHALSEVVAAINGRFLDTPERRTVQMLALASDGAVIADERAVATSLADLPKALGDISGPAVLLYGLAPRRAAAALTRLKEARS